VGLDNFACQRDKVFPEKLKNPADSAVHRLWDSCKIYLIQKEKD